MDKSPIPDLAIILARVKAYKPKSIAIPDGYRPSAVLILLSEGAEGPQVLLTQRSEAVSDHKGQVSFPGGGVEPNDPDTLATALREAFEEVGLDRERVTALGRLDDFPTMTKFHIVPWVATIPDFSGLRVNSPEITEVFAFPLHLMIGDHVQVLPWEYQGRVWDVIFVPHGDHLVWGATAFMLKSLLELV